MRTPRLPRALAPWLVALALSATPSSAAAIDPHTLLDRLREALAALWTGEAFTRANGCEFDPNGAGCPAAARPNGCQLDPDGAGCGGVLLDNGCQVDPNGGCGH